MDNKDDPKNLYVMYEKDDSVASLTAFYEIFGPLKGVKLIKSPIDNSPLFACLTFVEIEHAIEAKKSLLQIPSEKKLSILSSANNIIKEHKDIIVKSTNEYSLKLNELKSNSPKEENEKIIDLSSSEGIIEDSPDKHSSVFKRLQPKSPKKEHKRLSDSLSDDSSCSYPSKPKKSRSSKKEYTKKSDYSLENPSHSHSSRMLSKLPKQKHKKISNVSSKNSSRSHSSKSKRMRSKSPKRKHKTKDWPENVQKYDRLYCAIPNNIRGNGEEKVFLEFQQFGILDYIKIIYTDDKRPIGAYVKYLDSEDAKNAYRFCDLEFQAEWAKPLNDTRELFHKNCGNYVHHRHTKQHEIVCKLQQMMKHNSRNLNKISR